MGEEVKEKKPNKYVEGFKGFCTFLYNPDDHTVFGRGGSSWGKILIFYFFFYSCLAAFFAVCLVVMLNTLDPEKPTVVGRTNKPMVATPDTRLYELDFRTGNADADASWNAYKKGFEALQTKYANENSDEQFQWSPENLGDCHNYEWANKNLVRGCFFVGLNRIYNWSPDNQRLSFKCDWDEGKTGSGNMDPPFDIEMVNGAKIVSALDAYYPWTSMKEKGLQPMQAVKITKNDEKWALLKKEDSKDTYLKCMAYVGEEGAEKPLPEARAANFEIKYSFGTKSEE